ncbi:winged helix-turn-helix domain-containing protein [Xanthobacter sp. DSM 24535]|uniref:FadR/GntR family transcriptional regulator n=1 Tax=Roseixanthobacter psychrophilus TaxID=3119917 RepID=UPI003727E197
MERIEAQPTYQLVASSIEKRILEGIFTPGEQLPSELQLARQLGVNRSTVREAIRVLEQSGLVFRKSARRLVISVPLETALARQMTHAMILHEITFLELWEIMLPLEVRADEGAEYRLPLHHCQSVTKPIRQFCYAAFYRVMSRLSAKDCMLAYTETFEGIRGCDSKYAIFWMEKHIMDFRRGYELANFDINQPVDSDTVRRSN